MRARSAALPTAAYAAALVLTASAAILGHYLQHGQWLHWLAKPLATLLILWMVWSRPCALPRYRLAVLIGLALSALGDVWLMLPGDYFVPGLASFLLAHLAYVHALSTRAPLAARRWPFLLYALLALLMLTQLWPRLPAALQVPVLIYMLALAGMAAQALTVWRCHRDRASASAALGAACFVLSDATLAWDRFIAPLPLALLGVLASYWVAQWLLACSLPPVPLAGREQATHARKAADEPTRANGPSGKETSAR